MPNTAASDCDSKTAQPCQDHRGALLRCLAALLALVALSGFSGQSQQPPPPASADAAQAAPQETAPRPPPDLTRGVPAHAATQAATESLLRPDAAADRGVLFRVTAPGADRETSTGAAAGPSSARAEPAAPPRVGYLFGTIHFGTPQEQGIDYGKLGQYLDAITVFANEADIDSHWDPRFDSYRWLPARTSLSRLIGAEATAKAQELLPNVKPRDLQRMKPWMALALLEARGEHDDKASADVRLQRIASGAGKRVLHLESLEDQLQALDCVPAEEQARVLGERLRRPQFLQMDSAEAMAAYRARDLDAWLADVDRMEGLSDSAKRIEQRSRLCLLESRNARWFPQVEALFRGAQPALVAVGALHLAGPDGLIARLRRDGFKVEAVPLSEP